MAQTTAVQPVPDLEPLWGMDRTGLDELLDIIEASRPSWQADALCKEFASEISWFPERGEDVRAAREICRRCLVRTECTDWSLAQDASLQGIWGGLSGRERRRINAGELDPAPRQDDRFLIAEQRRARALEMSAAGINVSDIAAELGVSNDAVHRYLRAAA